MFKVGDFVVYGKTGVCKIIDICEKELIVNTKKQYYVLNPVFESKNIIYAPTDNEKIFMRNIITKAQAEELILKIPMIRKKIKFNEEELKELNTVLSSYTCDDLVGLTAQIYEKKKLAIENKKRLGFSDERIMRKSENLLFGELAVALGINIEDVQEYIKNKLRTDI